MENNCKCHHFSIFNNQLSFKIELINYQNYIPLSAHNMVFIGYKEIKGGLRGE